MHARLIKTVATAHWVLLLLLLVPAAMAAQAVDLTR